MLPIYVFSAILGAGLLLLGMVSGDADAADTDIIDVETHLGAHDAGWKKALSFRVFAYALAAFGLTGAGLTLLQSDPLLTLAGATVMAVFGGGLAGALFGWLKESESGFAETSASYIGGIGRAELRIPAGAGGSGRGRIELVHRGRAFTLPAVSRAGEIERNEPVIVLDVVEGVALVDRAPRELISEVES